MYRDGKEIGGCLGWGWGWEVTALGVSLWADANVVREDFSGGCTTADMLTLRRGNFTVCKLHLKQSKYDAGVR